MSHLLNEYHKKLLSEGRSQRTADLHTAYCRYFADWYGSENMKNVSKKDIEQYKIYLMSEHKTRYWGRRLTDASVSQRLWALKGYFKFLQKRKKIIVDPTIGLAVPKVRRFLRVRFVSGREIEELISKTDPETLLGRRDRLMFELFRTTDLKCSEISRIKLSDIDLKGKYIHLPTTKSGRKGAVPILPPTCEVLEKYLTEVRPQIVKASCKPDLPELLITRYGARVNVRNMMQIFRIYRGPGQAKMHIHPHALRHSLIKKDYECCLS